MRNKKGWYYILEKDIEKKLTTFIKSKGGLCIKLNSNTTVGLPDRLVILKDKIIFVELKAPNKKPRRVQILMMDKLKNLGCEVYVIDNVKDIENIFG